MADEHRISGRSELFFGLLIIVLGIIFLLSNLEVVEAGDVLRLWPVLLILLGAAKMYDAVTTSGRFFGLFFVALGALLLLDRLYIIHFRLHDWWPLLLIVLGASLLFRNPRRRMTSGTMTPPAGMTEEGDSVINVFSLLAGNKRICTSKEFAGGEATAIMGGCEIDLRRTAVKDKAAIINIFAFWGGIKISVPEGWNVVTDATAILGGVENKTRPGDPAHGPHLIIKGFAIMGGAEVTN